MKTSTATRPVSVKAYNSFVDRIHLVITNAAKRAAMLDALDRYLAGDRTGYADALTPDCAMAFEMLRFDIDQAIARSEKARMRVRTHKTPASPSDEKSDLMKAIDAMRATLAKAESTASTPKPFTAPLTRSERRAEARRSHIKSRWKKLSAGK